MKLRSAAGRLRNNSNSWNSFTTPSALNRNLVAVSSPAAVVPPYLNVICCEKIDIRLAFASYG